MNERGRLLQNLTVRLHSTGLSRAFYFSPSFQPSAPPSPVFRLTGRRPVPTLRGKSGGL